VKAAVYSTIETLDRIEPILAVVDVQADIVDDPVLCHKTDSKYDMVFIEIDSLPEEQAHRHHSALNHAVPIILLSASSRKLWEYNIGGQKIYGYVDLHNGDDELEARLKAIVRRIKDQTGLETTEERVVSETSFRNEEARCD